MSNGHGRRCPGGMAETMTGPTPQVRGVATGGRGGGRAEVSSPPSSACDCARACHRWQRPGGATRHRCGCWVPSRNCGSWRQHGAIHVSQRTRAGPVHDDVCTSQDAISAVIPATMPLSSVAEAPARAARFRPSVAARSRSVRCSTVTAGARPDARWTATRSAERTRARCAVVRVALAGLVGASSTMRLTIRQPRPSLAIRVPMLRKYVASPEPPSCALRSGASRVSSTSNW
jgi:hypothetical protein